MDHRRQPVTHVGVGEVQHWPGIDHAIPDDEEWEAPDALSRGLAATRLVVLIIACGLMTGIVVGIALALTLTALEGSI
ncbi:MAG: hypothetical protein FJW86_11195 [Actinobacteria bacterium]|nr:hypothetical protein [Actinomycetota bacterium]